MAKTVASARTSQLVTTYGVGSLFPAEDESYMLMGIDEWGPYAPVVDEPRLARSLGVEFFRTPPSGSSRGDVPVTRFPLMHYCPDCRRLARSYDFMSSSRDMECGQCHKRLVPSRFVACCENGHIEDFPYWAWVHRGAAGEGEHRLSLRSRGKSSSLDDLVVACSCGVAPRSMAGSFGKSALAQVSRCHAGRPWLSEDGANCDQELRTLQRGSSNVWFPLVRSAISIPPWSSAAARYVEERWSQLEDMTEEAVRSTTTKDARKRSNLSPDAVWALVQRRKGVFATQPPTEVELRNDEYTALRVGTVGQEPGDTFLCEEVDVHDTIEALVSQVSKVSRLREVRALQAFTRVLPPSPDADVRRAPLSDEHLPWLPAIEVHGEGVFVRLHEAVVAEWEESTFARARASRITDAAHRRDAAMGLAESPAVTPRKVVLHTLAHLLIDEMSPHAGYPASSLRERLYVGDGQAGILVYTASSDSAGSLGGLAALADTERFADVLLNALRSARWCSSDPVCAESEGSGADNLCLAACHACVLLPETSCEERNAYLDRSSVIGSIEDGSVGLAHRLTD
ncbi:DUF1998 domain-containing protein [uncultured Pseudokineococcus sp.]|uniref:DUF1998 domain-containing protein n=1 Tax=uncultured Pseudokineococcus sp. TaxID=1642928 RepID=UPI0026115B6F|nr:DUF1998 domain-containing protein [uncultured Pseudokineococcus sp.]